MNIKNKDDKNLTGNNKFCIIITFQICCCILGVILLIGVFFGKNGLLNTGLGILAVLGIMMGVSMLVFD